MKVKSVIRKLILGSGHIESDFEFKKAMLSGQIALLGIGLSLFYLVADYSQGFTYTLWIYLSAIAMFSFSIYLHRLRKHGIANYFLLPVADLVVYLMASSEAAGTGTFVFYITATLASFAVFGYKERLLSVFFTAFTFALFLLTYFVEFSILPVRHYSEDMILLNMVVNCSSCFGDVHLLAGKLQSLQFAEADGKQRPAFKSEHRA